MDAPQLVFGVLPKIEKKRCSICKEELPLRAFHRRRHYVRLGIRAACKACTAKATKAARVTRPQRIDRKKHRVRARTAAAIKRGVLSPKPCSTCGAPNADAHHPDYEGPEAHLRVKWLCDGCHALEHGRRAWTKQLEMFGAPSDGGHRTAAASHERHRRPSVRQGAQSGVDRGSGPR